jgi:hypothetical protein
VPGLPYRAAASMTAWPSVHLLRGFPKRGLLEQSVPERLSWAAIAALLLWLAIWWGLS